MEFVIIILIMLLIGTIAIMQYYRMMVSKEMKEVEGFENVIENYEAQIEKLQKELESELRMQQVWRERATIAWHNGYRYDAVETYKGYNNTFGTKAIEEVLVEKPEETE